MNKMPKCKFYAALLLGLFMAVSRATDARTEARVIITDLPSVFAEIDGLKQAEEFRQQVNGMENFMAIPRDSINEVIRALNLAVTGPFAKVELDSVMARLNADAFFTGNFRLEYGFTKFTYYCFRNDEPGKSVAGFEKWFPDKYTGIEEGFIWQVFHPEQDSPPFVAGFKLNYFDELTLFDADLMTEIGKQWSVNSSGQPFKLRAPGDTCSANYTADNFGVHELRVCNNVINADFVGSFGFCPSGSKFIFGNEKGELYVGDTNTGQMRMVHDSRFNQADMEGRLSPFFINNYQIVCYGAFNQGAWWLYDLREKEK